MISFIKIVTQLVFSIKTSRVQISPHTTIELLKKNDNNFFFFFFLVKNENHLSR
jgi:hypothetical protein